MGELRGGVGWASDIFCHRQKRDYLSRALQRAKGVTKKETNGKIYCPVGNLVGQSKLICASNVCHMPEFATQY